MRVVLALVVLVAAALAYDYPPENENFDVEHVVADHKLLRLYTACFIDVIPCDGIGARFKEHMRDAVETACAQCTPHQRHMFRLYLEGLEKELPEDYQAFVREFDPESQYFSVLMSTLTEDVVIDNK